MAYPQTLSAVHLNFVTVAGLLVLRGYLVVFFQMNWLLSYRKLHLKPLGFHFITITFLL